MNSEESGQPLKPYWHVDAKWIFGLLFGIIAAAAFALIFLYQISVKEAALNIASPIVASLFSPKGLDDDSDFAKATEIINLSPDHKLVPFPGIDISITQEDLVLTPRQIRLKLFSQLVEKSYENEGQLSIDGQMQSTGGLFIFSKKFHDMIFMPMIVCTSISLVFLFLHGFFSFGYGKLLNPANGLISFSVPLLLITYLSNKLFLEKPFDISILEGRASSAVIKYALHETLPEINKILSKDLLFICYVGLGLIILSIVLKIINVILRSSKTPGS